MVVGWVKYVYPLVKSDVNDSNPPFTTNSALTQVGDALGAKVGVRDGETVGVADGCAVGTALGTAVGFVVGMTVGIYVGVFVGARVGVALGTVHVVNEMSSRPKSLPVRMVFWLTMAIVAVVSDGGEVHSA